MYPDILKCSKIIPIYKKGEKNNIENYRPITIINNFSKSFEFLLYEPTFSYAKNRITEYQHGFFKGRSTTTNLFCITQYISDAIDANSQVDVIYTDFTKAFDTLDHNILCSKFQKFGFSKNLLLFFKSYLDNRQHYIDYFGQRSEKFVSTSGVPQGSVLGPLFFNIFINDITVDLGVNCLLYADDMKLYNKVDDINDSMTLQAALDKINVWCNLNKLQLNIKKCNVLTFTNKHQYIEFNYCLKDSELTRPPTFRDLGVTFDSKLSFNFHINTITNECFRTLGFIMRCSHDFNDINTSKLLYQSFVRSKLEYSSIIWSPHYNVHIQNIEKIQRRFLKTLCYKEDGVYPAIGFPHDILLDRFSLSSLETRRTISQQIFLFKLLHNVIDCAAILSLLSFRTPRPGSRHNSLFYLPTPRN